MARPRRISDEQIILTARRVFLEHGPQASTQLIADQLQVSQPALFKRFGSKRELMIAALAPRGIERVVTRLHGGPVSDDPQRELFELGLELCAFMREMVPCVSVLRSAGVDAIELLRQFDVPPPLRAIRAMTDWFRRGQDEALLRECDPQAVSVAFIGALHHRAFLHHILGRSATADELGSDEDYVRGVVDALWNGIRPGTNGDAAMETRA